MTDRSVECLRAGCEKRWKERGLSASPSWPEFSTRLEAEFPRLAELLWELYGNRPDFAYQVEDIVAEAFGGFEARPERLKKADRENPPETGWMSSHSQVGAVAYVDRFSRTFKGLEKRIPYLKELGVTYLHLMPFFRTPEGENDGGYAVSSYRETAPGLGTMKDLEDAALKLGENGIALVADFIFNHTSDGHDWALRAKRGERGFEDYYLVFAEKADTSVFASHLRDIFPDAKKGSFTFDETMKKWVWTTFHPYQWDLNYRNPEVFRAMSGEMIALANRGISVLRLDAVAFIWKEKGTPCENLDEAHTIIRAFQAISRLACPSLVFKSEAIVHPDEIERYVDLRECQLSYNPLLMAELWEAAATKEVRLLALSLGKRHRLPRGCAWVNYIRCHDDIGWTFADEDAAEIGIRGFDHRNFLNRFYLGDFPGSFSRGVSFQYNPETGDRRICGTAASLAGIERAKTEGLAKDLDTAVRRLILLYGIAFSAGGIPLVYLGDELAALNDYGYERDKSKAGDSRWVHRPLWSDERSAKRLEDGTVESRVFSGIARMSSVRRENPVFGESGLTVIESGHKSVLAYRKQAKGKILTVIGNFSESGVSLSGGTADRIAGNVTGHDLLSGRRRFPGDPVELEPCEIMWLSSEVD